jgi:hypothetical protein
MQRWEYLSVTWGYPEIKVGGRVVSNTKGTTPDGILDQLGTDGWELVTAVSESVCFGGTAKSEWVPIRFYLKRPLP